MSKSEFEHYRTAGELFGRLKARLGFGDLTMHSNEFSITFSWRFKVKKQHYAADHVFDFAYLDAQPDGYLAEVTEYVADQWKRQAKEAMTEFVG